MYRGHLLIVDDEESVRSVLKDFFKKIGYEVVTAESGEDALDALGQEDFDAVLLDINMPGLSGLDVVKLYRIGAMDQPRTPIIALSADATVETKEAALAAGIDVYLTKPVEPRRLIATIEASVAARADRRPPQSELGRVAAEGRPPEGETAGDAGEPEVLNGRSLAALNAFSGPDEDFALAILDDFIGNSERGVTR